MTLALSRALLIVEKLPLLLLAAVVSVDHLRRPNPRRSRGDPWQRLRCLYRAENALVSYAAYLVENAVAHAAWRCSIRIDAALPAGRSQAPPRSCSWHQRRRPEGRAAPSVSAHRLAVVPGHARAGALGWCTKALRPWRIDSRTSRWSASSSWQRGESRSCSDAGGTGRLACAVAAVVVLASLHRGRRHGSCGSGSDSLTLFQHALAVTRNNYVANFIIGSALQEQGRRDEAFPHLAESLRIAAELRQAELRHRPDLRRTRRSRRGAAALSRKRCASIRRTPRRTSASAWCWPHRATPTARSRTIARRYGSTPTSPPPTTTSPSHSRTWERSTRPSQQYAEGVRLEPQHAESRCNLAAALAGAGRVPGGHRAVPQGLAASSRSSSKRASAWRRAYAQAGQTHEAILELDDVLRQRPGLGPAAEATLAWLLATAPDRAAARRRACRAVGRASRRRDTGHTDADVLNSLAAAYAEVGRFADAVDTATQALPLAHASGRTALERTLNDRLAQYRAGQPVREPAGAGLPDDGQARRCAHATVALRACAAPAGGPRISGSLWRCSGSPPRCTRRPALWLYLLRRPRVRIPESVRDQPA